MRDSCRCVCGGVLTVGGFETVPDVVARHNRSPVHERWRERGGMGREVYGEPVGPERASDVLARMALTQTVVASAPATWHYEHGHRVDW